jgi:hypothetical protein
MTDDTDINVNPFGLTPFQIRVKSLKGRARRMKQYKNLPSHSHALDLVARQEGFVDWATFMERKGVKLGESK